MGFLTVGFAAGVDFVWVVAAGALGFLALSSPEVFLVGMGGLLNQNS
jgi:hypothetical protein